MQCLTTWVVRSVDEVSLAHDGNTWLTESDQEQAKDDFKNKCNDLFSQLLKPDQISDNVVPQPLLLFLNFKGRQ